MGHRVPEEEIGRQEHATGKGLASPGTPGPEPEMIYVPAGPFLMGTSQRQIDWLAQGDELARKWRAKGYFLREQPQHVVTLPAYWIGRYPVTVGQYRAFVEAGGYQQPVLWSAAGWAWRHAPQHGASGRVVPDYWGDAAWTGDDHLPVVGVSWYEAGAYCRWLALETGLAYRLPTEAEWEKAARGSDGRLYPWGYTFDPARCNTRQRPPDPDRTVGGRSTPVGAYSPAGDSPCGCGDMVGNVSEWTASLFLDYPLALPPSRLPRTAPGEEVDLYSLPGPEATGETEGRTRDERVLRGGSWHSPPLRARSTARGMNDPFFTDHDVGFRCARSP